MTVEALTGLRPGGDGPASITRAIRQAASQSGLDFELMLGVAKRESSLRPDAQASTSSASGLFQFIDQTWLGAVKEHGEELGLGDAARDIARTEKGFEVADPERRQEILDLRFKPEVAARVAGRTLAAAGERLSSALGREATGSEVYMAHFLGERGAVRMLSAGDDAVAAAIDPRAAGANQPLFYEGGRALSVAEFKDRIALHLGQEPAAKLEERPVYRGPLRPDAAPAPGAPPKTAPRMASDRAAALPPQLYAAIVEMQSDFILGDKS